MTLRTAVLALLPMLLSGGCALLPPQASAPALVMQDGDPAHRAEQLRGQARALRYSGRYAEALTRLDEAIALLPDAPDLPVERALTERSWQLMREETQDRIRIIEATERNERLPLLVRLVRANPTDTVHQAQLLRLRADLQLSASGLAECGQRQAQKAPDLARQCLRLARALRKTHHEQDPPVKQKSKPQARQPKPEIRTPDTPPSNGLAEARKLMRDGNHFGAVRQLKQLQENGLDTEESRRLLVQAETAMADGSKALLDAGDLLYSQGKVKAALAAWNAALNLDPNNPDALRKKERATRVLSNLQALEEGKTPPAAP